METVKTATLTRWDDQPLDHVNTIAGW